AAAATAGLVSQTLALIDMVGLMPRFWKASSRRQKPTRMPYSCHVQLGMSGTSEDIPPGGGEAWRGMHRSISHSSILTTGQMISRVPSSVRSGGRSKGELYGTRWRGCMKTLSLSQCELGV